jgi:hypothetical protein
MYPFILTDEALVPKERFLLILKHEFDAEGYEFKKSKNAFVGDFELGKREISASFITTSGIIHDVQFFMNIVFTDLEKIFKKAVPGYGWKNWTISYNLGSLQQWLCTQDTQQYTNQTLNAAAGTFFKMVKPVYNDIISKFDNYAYLEEQLNAQPTQWFVYSGRQDKRVINGLILRKYLRPDLSYSALKQAYLDTFTERFDYT